MVHPMESCWEMNGRTAKQWCGHAQMVQSFLHLWKAVRTVLGELGTLLCLVFLPPSLPELRLEPSTSPYAGKTLDRCATSLDFSVLEMGPYHGAQL